MIETDIITEEREFILNEIFKGGNTNPGGIEMKRVFILLLFLIASGVLFSWGGEFEYNIGYNGKSEEVDIFQNFGVDIYFDAQTDYGYFFSDVEATFFHGISMDASAAFSNPLLFCNRTNEGMLPTYMSLALGLDRFLININELYYEYSIEDFVLRLGRFKLQKGSGNLYSPSDVLSSSSMMGVGSTPVKEPIDGMQLQGYFDDLDMELFFTPYTNMSFPTYNTYMKTLMSSGYLTGYAAGVISAIDGPPTAVVNVSERYDFEQDYPLDYHDMNYGLRAGFTFYDILMRAAYYRDHFHFQVPTWIRQDYTRVSTTTTLDDGTVVPAGGLIYDSKAEFVIPARHTFTLDAQGDLFDSTIFYFEGSAMIPEKTETVLFFDYNGFYSTSTVLDTFDKSVYLKALAGIEYTGAMTGLGLEEDEFNLGFEIFNSLEGEYFSYSPGFETFLRINKADHDFTAAVVCAFSEIVDDYKFGVLVNAGMTYSGFEGFDVILDTSWGYAADELHPFYIPDGFLSSISLGAKGYF